MEFTKLFSQTEVERVHEASLEILENVGMLVRNEKALAIFAKNGCLVDMETKMVKFPRQVVEKARHTFVPTYTFTAQDPKFDITMPGDRPVVVTGSSAPNIIDPKTGEERRATSSDIANIAYLINELPGFDVFSISTLADDAPEGQFSMSRFYPALKNCKKPVRSNTPNMDDLKTVLELGALIAGSEEAYRERPFINHHYCPVVSPLTFDVESTEAVIYLLEQGLPVYGTIVPNAGMTSPLSLMGTLTLGNAEFLGLATLTQMIRPGAPMIYAVLSTVADMRTGAYAPGAIETGMMQMAHTEMARFYNVPSGGYIGLTNAHSNDAQSGYETGMNTTGALLAGADLFNMGGLLGSLMAFDFGKAVIDNEIALMLKRMKKGYEYSEENLCLDLIAKVGPGGSYMDLDHTMKNMRTVAVLPKVATREMRRRWEDQGKPDAHSRAMKEANKILSKPNKSRFSEELDAKIREHFKGLVPGDANWSL
ncbi:trimethylamine methyltransferase family protein [Desulfosporosinus metallidurans]|uniref:Trimethylamine methyltransferase family protein n=1 Tax=Desulfosporosinus metallidurans TaxID=1888891 RepID=A0A1Q8QG55_9FIRM|nr:trimethylamine methyltransferase family protein [Desulfosporosinus metallidurans]OLN26320.1 Trimethylamine methyltransferase family protein [Desulfosporosinus metallidurans]